MNFKGRDCISHMLQCLAGMHKHVDDSCKQGAEYLRRSSFIREKSACLAEVSVTEQILQNFPNLRNAGGTEHAQTMCTRLFFLCPRTRAWLSRNANMYRGESLVSFLRKHDVIKIGLKQKGNILCVFQPAVHSTLCVYDIQP